MTDETHLSGPDLQDAIADKIDELKSRRITREQWVRAQVTARSYNNADLLNEATQAIADCDDSIRQTRAELTALKRQDAIGARL